MEASQLNQRSIIEETGTCIMISKLCDETKKLGKDTGLLSLRKLLKTIRTLSLIKLMIHFRLVCFFTGLDEIILHLVMQAVRQVLQRRFVITEILLKHIVPISFLKLYCSYENCLLIWTAVFSNFMQ